MEYPWLPNWKKKLSAGEEIAYISLYRCTWDDMRIYSTVWNVYVQGTNINTVVMCRGENRSSVGSCGDEGVDGRRSHKDDNINIESRGKHQSVVKLRGVVSFSVHPWRPPFRIPHDNIRRLCRRKTNRVGRTAFAWRAAESTGYVRVQYKLWNG